MEAQSGGACEKLSRQVVVVELVPHNPHKKTNSESCEDLSRQVVARSVVAQLGSEYQRRHKVVEARIGSMQEVLPPNHHRKTDLV